MNNNDFRDLIISQKKSTEREKWSGKMLDYLYKVQENPDIATFAPGRIYRIWP
jgi:hypothetical protein